MTRGAGSDQSIKGRVRSARPLRTSRPSVSAIWPVSLPSPSVSAVRPARLRHLAHLRPSPSVSAVFGYNETENNIRKFFILFFLSWSHIWTRVNISDFSDHLRSTILVLVKMFFMNLVPWCFRIETQKEDNLGKTLSLKSDLRSRSRSFKTF